MLPSSHQLSLKLLERCPSCHAAIPTSHIHILSESELNMLAHLSCPRCLSKYLTYIMHHPQGLVGNAVLTDLTYDESVRTMDVLPLNENEVLELHRAVHNPEFMYRITINSNR